MDSPPSCPGFNVVKHGGCFRIKDWRDILLGPCHSLASLSFLLTQRESSLLATPPHKPGRRTRVSPGTESISGREDPSTTAGLPTLVDPSSLRLPEHTTPPPTPAELPDKIQDTQGGLNFRKTAEQFSYMYIPRIPRETHISDENKKFLRVSISQILPGIYLY